MRGIMDFEITGEETQEQLEELMAKMGEIEVKGDDEEPEESAEHPGSESSETVQTDTCDKQAPTPGAGTEEEGQPQEDVKGILARDGKHVIPYDVLEAERTGRQRVEQEAFLLKQQLAEEQRKIDLLTSQIKQAGMTPDPLTYCMSRRASGMTGTPALPARTGNRYYPKLETLMNLGTDNQLMNAQLDRTGGIAAQSLRSAQLGLNNQMARYGTTSPACRPCSYCYFKN